jgi:hypothetical protein
LQLQFVSVEPDEQGGVNPAQINPIRSQIWTLDVGEPVDGRRTLVGSATNLGPLEFQEMTAEWRAAQMRAFTEALTAGADFRSKIPDEPQTVLRFKLDSATKQISGEMVATVGHNRFYNGVPHNGELTEVDGLPAVSVSAQLPADAPVPLNVRMSWVGIQTPEGLLLTGLLDNLLSGGRFQSEFIAPTE